VDVPGATVTAVSGINDFGWLVGRYTDSSNVHHGFVAIPTRSTGQTCPETSSVFIINAYRATVWNSRHDFLEACAE
jgi:hypothetical protein